MNIFILDKNIDKCAEYYVDSHMKIILEIAQMMSTAVWDLLSRPDAQTLKKHGLYRPSHVNHPISIWVRRSKDNFLWTASMAEALNREKLFRWPSRPSHKSIEIVRNAYKFHEQFNDIGSTPFAVAMPDEFKTKDPIESYRNYYREGKKHLHKWTRRKTPIWI